MAFAVARRVRAVQGLQLKLQHQQVVNQIRPLWGVAPDSRDDLTVPMSITMPEPTFLGSTPTQVTTLGNGMRVASSDLSLPCATVGMYIETGSSCEPVSGTAHVLQHMAFKTTEGSSHLRMVRSGERLGATAFAMAGREHMVYQVDTLKESVPEVVQLLAETLFAPKLLPWEVDEEKQVIKSELEDLKKNPQQLLQELCHTAAFGSKSPLGKPLFCPPRMLGEISPEVLRSFVNSEFCPSRMVLTAAGYDHAELVALAEATFGKLPPGAPKSPKPTTYIGGEYRLGAEDETVPVQHVSGEYEVTSHEVLTHFSLAFKSPGYKDKDLVPLCVLNMMMGGGMSFSAGGPGKGMYTRLYQNILNRDASVTAATVFSIFYNDVGLFGVYAAAPADAIGAVATTVCEEMKKMAASVSAEELSRAKNALESSLLMNLESRALLFDDIGRQVLTYGKRTPPEELVEQIRAVSADDLTTLAKTMLKSPPTIAVYGDTTAVPRYDQVAAFFK